MHSVCLLIRVVHAESRRGFSCSSRYIWGCLPSSAVLYEVVGISFASSNDPYSNPFDPGVISATVTVTPPSGPPVEVMAFWYQNYTPSGGNAGWETYSPAEARSGWPVLLPPSWERTPFPSNSPTPREPIHHESRLPLRSGRLGQPRVRATSPVQRRIPRALERRHLPPDRPQRAFREGAPTSSMDGTVLWEEYYQRLESSGENWSRFWMTDFDRTALEWETGLWGAAPDNFDYQGLGKYSLKAAWRVDQKLAAAQEHGVYVQLVLNDHGQFSNHVNARWNGSFSPNGAYANPYNTAAGGPVADPNDYFGNATCREMTKQKLRYIVARYGAYRSVMAWELFNEVQFTGNSFQDSFRHRRGS